MMSRAGLVFYLSRTIEMLVLSRKQLERVVITVPASSVAQTIEVSVVSLRGDKVRIGFQADRRVSVHRQEVNEAIRKEQTLVEST